MVEQTVIVWCIRSNEDLFLVNGGPETLGHCRGRLHGGVEIYVFDIETHPAAQHRIVECNCDSKCGADFADESACVSAIMEISPPLLGSEFYSSRIRQRSRRRYSGGRRTQRIAQPLLREFVLRIEINGAAEFP